MAQLLVLGELPATAAEVFSLPEHRAIVGLLRLDLPTVIVLPLYLLFLGLFAPLRQAVRARAICATSLAFVGVKLVLATPTALSLILLSESMAQRPRRRQEISYLMQKSDPGHRYVARNGAMMGGILGQSGAVLICVVMLRNAVFSKTTAYLGIVTHGLDLAHIVFGLLLPIIGTILMAVAGPLYPIWLFLVGRRPFQLAAASSTGKPF